MENPIIELKLPAASVQVVLNALGTRPLAEVFDTFVAVRSQAERALTAPAAGGAGAAEAKNAAATTAADEPSNG